MVKKHLFYIFYWAAFTHTFATLFLPDVEKNYSSTIIIMFLFYIKRIVSYHCCKRLIFRITLWLPCKWDQKCRKPIPNIPCYIFALSRQSRVCNTMCSKSCLYWGFLQCRSREFTYFHGGKRKYSVISTDFGHKNSDQSRRA